MEIDIALNRVRVLNDDAREHFTDGRIVDQVADPSAEVVLDRLKVLGG